LNTRWHDVMGGGDIMLLVSFNVVHYSRNKDAKLEMKMKNWK